MHEWTGLAVPRDDGRAADSAPLEDGVERFQGESTGVHPGAVAGEAISFKERPDFSFKSRIVGWRGGPHDGGWCRGQEKNHDYRHQREFRSAHSFVHLEYRLRIERIAFRSRWENYHKRNRNRKLLFGVGGRIA
jgi:hypothetical protein